MSQKSSPAKPLTPREMDILRLLARGYSNREIADALVLSVGTVKWYNRQIYNKLGVNSREAAVAAARASGILPRAQRPHNLPGALTPFVGREVERRALTALIGRSDVRLVTVLGAGGIGKTRLALEAGRYFVEAGAGGTFADGIIFVDLAPAGDTAQIVTAIADALAFRFPAGSVRPEQQLLAHLRRKALLLILDNFDHLLLSATLVAEILSAAPEVKILVTSRERLNLSGEMIFSLEGLDYPSRATVENALTYSAVQLFKQAAQRGRRDFTITGDNLPDVLRLCRLVQGMPLGIILAANWVRVLSPREINDEIAQSIDFLASEQRDLPKRLRSMRAVFDYSWKLMTADEASAFVRLCVFRGGFTREAAQSVAGADVRLLVALANKSLLQYEPEKKRYYIHELLRQYAGQQPQARAQWETVQGEHAAYYAALATRAAPELRRGQQERWFDLLAAEHDNMRAAMAWSFGRGEGTPGLRIVVALRDFWFYEGYHAEGQRWCEQALAQRPPDDPVLEGRVRLALGLFAWARHDMETCRTNWEEALALFREAGDERLAAWALGLLGGSKAGNDPGGYEEDVARLRRSIATLRAAGDQPGVAQMLNILGNVQRIPGTYARAKEAYEACLRVVRETGEKRRQCIILENLALVAFAEGDYEATISHALECVRLADEIGFRQLRFLPLHPLAGALAASGHVADAARLAGMLDAYRDRRSVAFPPNDQHFHDAIDKEVRARLKEEAFRAAWEEGYHLAPDEAITYALSLP